MQLTRSADWVGQRAHRAGWPFVMQAVQRFANGKGILVDDFCEQTFAYNPKSNNDNHIKQHLSNPWIGILHHPRKIDSPLKHDVGHELLNIGERRDFQRCLHNLKGIVVLTEDTETFVSNWLKVPVQVIKHPTDLNCKAWNVKEYLRDRIVYAPGFFLRDTRILHRLPKIASYTYCRTKPFLQWMKQRDRRIKNLWRQYETHNDMHELSFLDNVAYDLIMSKCVVVTWLFGAAANNTIVECIARATPIIVNRWPAVVEYLGENYPLLVDSPSEIHNYLLDDERIVAAHEYLLKLRSEATWLNPNSFAKELASCCESLEAVGV